MAHAGKALLHTDASQTMGKIPVEVAALGADLVTVTGHKMYAPAGVGALYVRARVELEPLVYGGGQEGGRRGGTENIVGIAALGRAATLVDTQTGAHLTRLRDALHQQLDEALPGRVHLNGHSHRRLPNTLNIRIEGTTGNRLLAAVDQIAASTGSACHEGTDQPSPVLTAMGQPADQANAALRLTLGRWSTETDIEHAAALLTQAAHQTVTS
ncbi:cysteine desulfurase family protein [Fodinicola feengrottensis]|uniref:cysteine desulfurase family protein n=1 Tax=Fodinicola feengrottensis TaxID=435914 RepID=UPI0024424A48|nr:aminotransferase class V-fold PLP-dependent enzyme [Fodinicola feengrottensis]